jgi:hypothetical protein
MTTTPRPSPVAIIPRLAIRYGLVLTAVLLVAGSVIGYLVAGVPGLLSGLIGAGLTAVFMGFTAGSLLLGVRATRGDTTSPAFYGIVLGVLAAKLIVFVILIVSLRGADWLEPAVLGVSMIAAVIGSLAVDVLAFVRARVPYVDVELPGEGSSS